MTNNKLEITKKYCVMQVLDDSEFATPKEYFDNEEKAVNFLKDISEKDKEHHYFISIDKVPEEFIFFADMWKAVRGKIDE